MKQQDNDTRLTRLKQIVASMPEKPGSYQFYDEAHIIIYVGKAKNLKRRVSSYFHTEVDRFKTKVLVSKIHDITYTVVRTEEDALLLENSLIKRYTPRYNVLLKDGKTYPSICMTREEFPRIFKTRRIVKGAGNYYGPYSHLPAMYNILELIGQVCQPRKCRQTMTRESVAAGRHKTCLEYHIHRCAAPCTGRQTWDDYQQKMRMAHEILRGNTRSLSEQLYAEMQRLAAELRFEEAETMKQRYQLLAQYVSRSEVVSHTIDNVDVFSITADEGEAEAYVNYMHVAQGTVCQSFTFEYRRKLDESPEELLLTAIIEIRERYQSTATEVIVPTETDWQLPGATLFVPQRGDKRHLVELSLMNGRQYRFDRMKQTEKLNPEQRQTRLMRELQQMLHLSALPYTIECFDNSNISGTDAVAGCVVFRGMRPSKKDYRRYQIRTVTGPDDYASMQEVVRRRYTRLRDEGQPLPDLIVTDGGVGQMSVVREVVEGELGLHIPIAGLAKDFHHRTRELLYGDPVETVGLDPKGELFHALTRLQDEVHRYAIAYHRDKRSARALHSWLDDVAGIGPKTRDRLLGVFRSVRGVMQATPEQLAEAVGAAKAKAIVEAREKGEETDGE